MNLDDDGFTLVFTRRCGKKPAINGRRTGTNLRTVQQIKSVCVFISRLEANVPNATVKEIVDDMIGIPCKV